MEQTSWNLDICILIFQFAHMLLLLAFLSGLFLRKLLPVRFSEEEPLRGLPVQDCLQVGYHPITQPTVTKHRRNLVLRQLTQKQNTVMFIFACPVETVTSNR